jgi:hypothetical protein
MKPMMKRRLLSSIAAWLMLSALPALAQSSINTGQPATASDLSSLVVRQLALAAASDINGIVGMHKATSLAQCPSGVGLVVGEDCLTVGASPYVWYKWTGNAGGWALIANVNPSTGVISIGLNAGDLAATPPIAANFAGGVATLSINLDSNFAVNGFSQLSLTPGAGNLVLASPNGSSGEPSLRALVGADLPTPTPTTLGGIESYATVAHQWINGISTGGVPSSTQPSASDLSNGTTGSGAVVLGTSPTLTTPNLGTPSAVNLANATNLPIGSIASLGTGVGAAIANAVSSPSGMTLDVAAGTATINPGAIGATSCSSAITVAATGVATTDVVDAGFSADPTGTTGYTAGAQLSIVAWPTAGNVNFKACNNTGLAITPTSITINWKVRR